MSMRPDELRARHEATLPEWMPLYYEKPMELVRGEGYRVWDSEGNEYLDFFGGIVTTISGHSIPEITEAIRSQVDKIVHSSTLYLIENQVRLAEKLTQLAPIFATKYRGSSEIVALRSSYHGRSFATMGVTGQSIWSPTSRSALDVRYLANPYRYRCPFCKDEPRCNLLCADDLRGLIEAETTGHIAAFIAEPIQGVGGFIEAPLGYFERIKEILDETGALLISDEVQTAFGRTGSHFWGIDAFDVEPDLITMAKGLGNGLSIGAVMGRAEIIDSLSPKQHVSTFGGNHLSTAGALANLNYVLEHDLQSNADEVGGYLKDRLIKMAESHPVVGEVRGRGLMLGIELVGPDGEPNPPAAVGFMQACRGRGVLVGKGGINGNAVRISPPLTITREAAEEAANVFEEALAEVGTAERVG